MWSAPTLNCNTDVVTASVGSLLTAPPGTAHTFANPADTAAFIRCTITPDLYIEYFREVGATSPTPGGLEPVAVGELMTRYATETFTPGCRRELGAQGHRVNCAPTSLLN